MKKLLRQCGLLAVVAALALLSGCRKKKEPTVTPQAQAPSITTPAQPTQSAPPPPGTGPAPSTAPATTPSATAPASTPVKKPVPKKKRKPRTQVAKKTNGTEPQPAPQSAAQPANQAATIPPPAQPAIAPTPGATTPAATTPPSAVGSSPASGKPAADAPTVDISAAMDHSQEARQRELTQQLLSSTEANLKGITRALTADERAMVDDIRNYMAQSRAAISDGDYTRANNLATKAHLLSDELIKH